MNLTPEEIVTELDKHVVGQSRAKRAVAIALAIAGGVSKCPNHCDMKSRRKTY